MGNQKTFNIKILKLLKTNIDQSLSAAILESNF